MNSPDLYTVGALLLVAAGLFSISGAIKTAGSRIARAIWHSDFQTPPNWLD